MMNARRLKILVGVDGSACSMRAVRHAAQLALRLDAEIDLVHVFPYTATATLAELAFINDQTSGFAEAKRQLVELRESELPAGLPVQIHMRLGDPVRGLLDATEQLGPDMVILGTHGRGTVMRAIMGSVSEQLIRKSPVPVVVVPPDREAAPAATGRVEEPPRPGDPV